MRKHGAGAQKSHVDFWVEVVDTRVVFFAKVK